MSSRTINNYRYFCNTENKYVYDWNETTPITCSHDSTHHIDDSSFTIIDTIDNNTIVINQKSGDVQGNYRVESRVMYIPANQTMSSILSWPFNISIMTVNWTTSEIHRGDIINGYVADNTTIGSITKKVNIGDTLLYVSQNVFNYINKGYIITITDRTQSINMGQCISIDKAAGTIVCENQSGMSLNENSYLQITINNMRNIHIGEPESIRLANKHLGSTCITAGTKLRLQYQNNSSKAKTFVFQYEYLY